VVRPGTVPLDLLVVLPDPVRRVGHGVVGPGLRGVERRGVLGELVEVRSDVLAETLGLVEGRVGLDLQPAGSSCWPSAMKGAASLSVTMCVGSHSSRGVPRRWCSWTVIWAKRTACLYSLLGISSLAASLSVRAGSHLVISTDMAIAFFAWPVSGHRSARPPTSPSCGAGSVLRPIEERGGCPTSLAGRSMCGAAPESRVSLSAGLACDRTPAARRYNSLIRRTSASGSLSRLIARSCAARHSIFSQAVGEPRKTLQTVSGEILSTFFGFLFTAAAMSRVLGSPAF
jgi:hypothetical protein